MREYFFGRGEMDHYSRDSLRKLWIQSRGIATANLLRTEGFQFVILIMP